MENQNNFSDDSVFNKLEADLKKIGLEGESENLITIVKEFSRLAKKVNHEQIHALISLVEAIHFALNMAHMHIALKDDLDVDEGEENHGH